MKLTTNKLLFIATAIIMLFMVVSTYQYNLIKDYQRLIESIDTTTTTKLIHDTVYKDTTIIDKQPIIKYKTITKTDTLYKDTIPFILTKENKTFSNTIINDGDTTTYQAHISGYNVNNDSLPRLDSLKLHTSHRIINTVQYTTQVIKVPQKDRKWHLSPSIGFGYGLTKKETDIYLGVAFGYNIWNK